MSNAIRLVTFAMPKYGEQIVAVKNDFGMNIGLFDAATALDGCTLEGVPAKDTARVFAERLVAQTNAAADLLEAARAVSEAHAATTGIDFQGWCQVLAERIDTLSAAIAKAEGQIVTRPPAELQNAEKT